MSIDYQPISLAHGFPDYPVPKYITDALASATQSPDDSLNQYARGYVSEVTILSNSIYFKCVFLLSKGHTRLVEALSELYSKLTDRKIDAISEILVTCGAYEALYTSIQGSVKYLKLLR